MSFPVTRLRRLRYLPQMRALTRQVHLAPGQMILPLFVRDGDGPRREIASMPGQYQLSLGDLEREAEEAQRLGLGGVMLFGVPSHKDDFGSESYQPNGIVQRAVRAVKAAASELLVVTDVCFCEYTSHGHCGVVRETSHGRDVDNDATLQLLARQAASHAEAGADVIAPSGMMDGMVAAIRAGLDQAGKTETPILSYAAKYASAFYGPFRDAAESAPQFGDRRTYQMDYAADPGQALREVEQDLAEGADLVMVKPALAYLDVIHRVRARFPGVPLAAYNVSGEYSMLKAAIAQGWLDERAVVLESLTAIRRAGADVVFTYWAKDVARWL